MNRLSVSVILFLAMACAAPARGQWEVPPIRHIAVEGHGEVEIEPDLCEVDLGVFILEKDLRKGKAEADKRIAALLAVLGELKIPLADLQSTRLYIKPVYKDAWENPQLIGYEVTRSVHVKLRDLAKLDEMLDKAIEAGANRDFDIDLGTSKEDQLRSKAVENAVADAKRQASALAEQFGAKLGRVYSIAHGEESSSMLCCAFGPTFGEGTFQPGRIRISTEIAVVFELADD